MLRRRSNKVVVITGASAGVGRAAAREFARSGADVALLARNAEALDNARAEVESHGRRGLGIPVDVSDADAVERATLAIESQLGPIDVWVNNAMVTVFSPVALRQPDEVRRVTEVTSLGNRRDNLWRTAPGDHGACGRFRDRASNRSRELWLTTHRSLLLSACAAGAGLAWLAAARLSGR